ncbi:TetR family transcriptional regulator [Stackebrandtia albiflava]|uniref:TetR family transcriptional regulator n=1 Tax=Stackebrandtia albiflava TaxID=406432 RepID=A0A562UQT6_9ACTN|nr:TetR/AcrR family transcriptional regulator [Stackebrandtia albiflava]TWJ07971.1 TetR family transcriptional regulator [Stackebrandtia albiflava]
MGAEELAKAALRTLNAEPTASMSRIAASAGVSRATLHRNFASREDLIRQLGRMSLDSWRQALDTADVDAAGGSGDPERIRVAMNVLCRELVRDADEYGFTLTLTEHVQDAAIAAESVRLHEREMAFYAAAQESGLLRRDMPAAWIAYTVFGLLVGLRDALRHGAVAVRDAERLLRDTILHGVSA